MIESRPVLFDIKRGQTQSLFPDADFHAELADGIISYTREFADEVYHEGLIFRGLRSFRFRAESHCTRWHSVGAYNALVEVLDSEWVAELDQISSPKGRPWPMHHFLIYIEDAGCFEMASESWEVLSDTTS